VTSKPTTPDQQGEPPLPEASLEAFAVQPSPHPSQRRESSLAALGAWPDIYASVQAIFDVPAAHPSITTDIAEDARERLRRLDDAVNQIDPNVTPAPEDGLGSWMDWASKHLGAEHPVTVALLNKSIADAAAAQPDTSQDWSRLDGALAFQVIQSHAETATEINQMMETWGKARYANVDVLPTEAASLLHQKAGTLREMFNDLECKVCSDNISLAPQRNMIQQLMDMTVTLFEPVEALNGQLRLRCRDRRNFELWLRSVSGVANLKRRRPTGQYIDPATYWAWRAFTAPVVSGELPPNFFETLRKKVESFLSDKRLLTAHSELECARCGYETSNADEQAAVRDILATIAEAELALAGDDSRAGANVTKLDEAPL
jgi:hypothetical protein